VDPRLSPYAPPPDAQFDGLNATMLRRAGERDGARERWAIGTPFADEPVATVTVATRRPLGLPDRAAGSLIRRRRRGRTAVAALAAAALAAILAAAAVASGPAAVLVVTLVLAVVVLAGLASVGRTASRLAAAPGSGSLDDLAAAVADALHAAGLTSRGGDAVRVEAQGDGGYRARLQEVPAAESALFAEALDEVLAPLSQPRYVIPRLILPPPAGPAAAAGLAVRRLVTGHVPATVVYHAVPTVLSGNKKLALAFERAWNARVGPGSVVYAGPERDGSPARPPGNPGGRAVACRPRGWPLAGRARGTVQHRRALGHPLRGRQPTQTRGHDYLSGAGEPARLGRGGGHVELERVRPANQRQRLRVGAGQRGPAGRRRDQELLHEAGAGALPREGQDRLAAH
jgi:hypothetical protein